MPDRACSISDCDRPVLSRGWCAAHYQRWRSHGDPLGGSTFRKPKRERRPCSVPECDRESQTAELCKLHHRRLKVTGTTDRVQRLCTLDGCEKRWYSTGYCRTHWERWREFGDPSIFRQCSIEGCSRRAPAGKRGWCVLHYTRWHRYGDPGQAASRFFEPPHEPADGFLWCITCRTEQPVKDFWREKQTDHGYARTCRTCRQDWRMAASYGIDGATYRRLLDEQGHVCRICGKPETAAHQSGVVRRLSVDHDHKCCPGKKSCGKCVRGLLCARCNSAIGLFDEDRGRLLAAVAYIGGTPVPAGVWDEEAA